MFVLYTNKIRILIVVDCKRRQVWFVYFIYNVHTLHALHTISIITCYKETCLIIILLVTLSSRVITLWLQTVHREDSSRIIGLMMYWWAAFLKRNKLSHTSPETDINLGIQRVFRCIILKKNMRVISMFVWCVVRYYLQRVEKKRSKSTDRFRKTFDGD